MFRFDPYSPETDANPFPAYKTLRDEYPCFWSDDVNMWVLSRYNDIMNALNDWQTYSSAKGNLVDELPNRAGNTLGTTDPPRHDRMRALIQKPVTKRALKHMEEPTLAICKTNLERLEGRSSFDFVAEYGSNVTVDLLFHLLNIPDEGREEVRSNAVLMVQTDAKTRKKAPEHIAAYEWMSNYARNLVEERKRNPGEDLLSQLIASEIDGEKLRDDEVRLTITTLLMAGIESLSGFMSVFGYNLATYGDARRALAKDLSLIPDAMEESLRYNTSAQRFRRCLTKDVELHGQTMKAGDFVMVAYGSGNRDERQFENADVYDIYRKPKGHLGFGGGTHACFGTSIARMACRIAFGEFLQRYPEFELSGEDIPWVPSSNFRSPTKLQLIVS